MEALPAPGLASVALGVTPLHTDEGRRPQPTQLSSAMLRTWLQLYTNLPALPSVREAARPALLLAALSRLNPGVDGAPTSCQRILSCCLIRSRLLSVAF